MQKVLDFYSNIAYNKGMKVEKELEMKEVVMKVVNVVWVAFWTILLAPFLIPAFGIVKLLGGDPFSMDGMGADFLFMVIIAVGIAIAVGAFTIGYFI